MTYEVPALSVYTEAAVVSGARLTNGNTTAATIPGSASAFFVCVAVTAFTGGTNITYALQQQDANGNWVTVGSTAAITAVGNYAFSVGPGMANGQLLIPGSKYQVAWTVSGTFTGLTSQIGVSGR